MDTVKGQCLICEKQLSKDSQEMVTPTSSSQLEMFFLLRKVLEVADSVLLKFLEASPSGIAMTRPRLCDLCEMAVKECREVHEQLCELQTKWNHCRTKIVSQITETTEIRPPQENGHSSSLDLKKEARRFMMTQVNLLSQDTPKGLLSDVGTQMTRSSNMISSGDQAGSASLPIITEVLMNSSTTRQLRTPRERSHACPRCSKKYVNPYLLQKHLLTHSKNENTATSNYKQYKCGDCGKQFAKVSHLKLHQLIHTGEKPHECQLCNQRFRHALTLECHMKAHLGERHFKCEVCGKAFVTEQHLTRHGAMHTGEKCFKCEICGKTFVRKEDLMIHVATHTGEKYFKCRLCPEAYRSRYMLSSHKKIHLPNQI